MKTFFICVCIVLAVYALTEDDQATWKQFKNKHRKNFTSKKTEEKRKQIFLDRHRRVIKHNERFDKGLETFKKKIYDTADLSRDEFVAKYTGIK